MSKKYYNLENIIKDLYDYSSLNKITEKKDKYTITNNSNSSDDWYTTSTTDNTKINTGSGWSTGSGGYSSGTVTLPNTIGPGTTGGWSSGTWTTIAYPGVLGEDEEAWPKVEDALGVVFIDGDEIKLKTKNGKEVVVGRLDDSDDFIPLEVVAAKKKLLEESNEQQSAK